MRAVFAVIVLSLILSRWHTAWAFAFHAIHFAESDTEGDEQIKQWTAKRIILETSRGIPNPH